MNLVGTSLELEHVDGTVYTGVFHTFSSTEAKDYAVVLKGVQVASPPESKPSPLCFLRLVKRSARL